MGKAPNAVNLSTAGRIKTLLVGVLQREPVREQPVSFHVKEQGKPTRGQVTRGRGSRPTMPLRPTWMKEDLAESLVGEQLSYYGNNALTTEERRPVV